MERIKMKLAFHGTSHQNATNILKEGFKPDRQNWTNSNGNTFAFYLPDKFQAFQTAFTQAGTSTYYHPLSCKHAVVGIDINGMSFTKDTTKSVPYEYSIEITDQITSERIVAIWTINGNLSIFRAFMQYLTKQSNNNNYNLTREEETYAYHFMQACKASEEKRAELYLKPILMYKNEKYQDIPDFTEKYLVV